MEVSMTHQLWLIVRFFIFGVLSGALYDAVRVFRVFVLACDYSGSSAVILSLDRMIGRIKKPTPKLFGKCYSAAVVVITDAVFSLTIGLGFIVFLYHENYLIFRWYLLLGAVLGFASYYFTVGRVVITLADTALALITALLRVIYKPIKSLFRLVAHLSCLFWWVTGGRLVLHLKIRRAEKRTEDAMKHLAEIVKISY